MLHSITHSATDITHTISEDAGYGKKYSICTLITNEAIYSKMLESFLKGGFSPDFCEYLFINNTGENAYDAYNGINKFLSTARGQYIIFCHQDVLLCHDGIDRLEACIDQLNQLDPNWAAIGNAGAINPAHMARRISDPHGRNLRQSPVGFPAKVQSLDENFILVRKDANLGLSNDLKGFHFYGLDLCLLASIRGYSSYVVDFHLMHLGPGQRDAAFYACKNNFIEKYTKALSGRFLRTTCENFYLSGSRIMNALFSLGVARNIARKYYKNRLPASQGNKNKSP